MLSLLMKRSYYSIQKKTYFCGIVTYTGYFAETVLNMVLLRKYYQLLAISMIASEKEAN